MNQHFRVCFVACMVLSALFITACTSSELRQRYAGATSIRAIQGRGDTSPLEGQSVENVVGVVTAIMPGKGFYLQEPRLSPDPFADDAPSFDEASSAIFAISFRRPDFEVGDILSVQGRVVEDYPGGIERGELSSTSIRVREIEHIGRAGGDWIIEPEALGARGRAFPTESIYPDGLAFYEALEHMLVRLPDAQVMGGVHTAFGEIAVATDRGRFVTGRNARGGATLSEDDGNPELLFIDLIEFPAPLQIPSPELPELGDYYDGDIDGVLYYSFGTYKVLPTRELPDLVRNPLERELSSLPPANEPGALSFASFNVQNLSALSGEQKFADLADTIAVALDGPDVVALQEIQDNNGEEIDDGTVAADRTWSALVDAVIAAGGPSYDWIDGPPENNRDGGAPGANIRVGFLFNPDRVRLAGEPRRFGDELSAYAASRKPFVARFAFTDSAVDAGPLADGIVFVNVHFTSKGGDASPWGRRQPPRYASETQRIRQSASLIDGLRDEFGDDLSAAPLVILGDMNEFYFREPLREFDRAGLVNVAERLLPEEEIYSYIYQHNSQALDHAYVAESLFNSFDVTVQYVHRYAEYLYGERQSDHDPLLVHLSPR